MAPSSSPVVPAASFLRELRLTAGFTSARQAAQAMGAPVATYTQHESGARSFTADQAFDYGAFFIGVRATSWRRLNQQPPLSHDHLAAKIHAIIGQRRELRPLWGEITDDEREPYRRAADAVFRFNERPLPEKREQAARDRQNGQEQRP